MVKPYTDKLLDRSTRIRTFESTVTSSELVWHRDRQTRQVTVLEGTGWELQLDNQLPQKLIPGNTYTIPAEMFHRVRCGTNNLEIKIIEST